MRCRSSTPTASRGTNFTSTSPNQVGTGTQALYNTSTGVHQHEWADVCRYQRRHLFQPVYDNTNTGGPHQFCQYSFFGRGDSSGTYGGQRQQHGVYVCAIRQHAQVFRNGGTIFSYAPPNVYLTPTGGATPTQFSALAAVLYAVEVLAAGAADGERGLGGYVSHA